MPLTHALAITICIYVNCKGVSLVVILGRHLQVYCSRPIFKNTYKKLVVAFKYVRIMDSSIEECPLFLP